MSAFFIQPCREPSEIPKSFAICFNGDWLFRATATTSSRNSFGYAFAMIDILPARTNPHRSGDNQTLGSPNRKAGPPVHDDRVKREFTAPDVNRLWLTDITEHHTAWIPAVVATPDEGGGDGGQEVHGRAEERVLPGPRSRRHRPCRGACCRSERARGL